MYNIDQETLTVQQLVFLHYLKRKSVSMTQIDTEHLYETVGLIRGCSTDPEQWLWLGTPFSLVYLHGSIVHVYIKRDGLIRRLDNHCQPAATPVYSTTITTCTYNYCDSTCKQPPRPHQPPFLCNFQISAHLYTTCICVPWKCPDMHCDFHCLHTTLVYCVTEQGRVAYKV